MGVATAVALLVIGLIGQDQALKGDEWGYAGRLASEPTLVAILEPPPGKYLIAMPLLVYEGLLETAGAADYFPFRLVGMFLTAAVACLVFAFVKRRMGALPALGAGLVLLFFGAATDVVAQPLRLPSQFAVAAGVGAFLAFDRDARARDLVGCALLLVAVTSHPVGLAFLAGSIPLVVGHPANGGVRRWWVFGVPGIAFTAWWVVFREGMSDGAGVPWDLASFVAKELAAAVAALTGVFRDPFTGSLDFLTPVSWLALAALAIALGVCVLQRGVDRRLVATGCALAVSLIAPAFASGDARDPESVRYLYPNAVLLILFAAEAFRAFRPRLAPGGAVGVGVLVLLAFGFAMFSNVTTLIEEAPKLADRSERLRAQISALELAGARVSPAFRTRELPESARIPRSGFDVTAGDYLRASAAYGTPAYTPAQLAEQGRKLMMMADVVLIHATGLALREPGRRGQEVCRKVTVPKAQSGSPIELGPGSYLLSARGTSPLRAGVSRFADRPAKILVARGRQETARLTLPADEWPGPWRIDARGFARVCRLP